MSSWPYKKSWVFSSPSASLKYWNSPGSSDSNSYIEMRTHFTEKGSIEWVNVLGIDLYRSNTRISLDVHVLVEMISLCATDFFTQNGFPLWRVKLWHLLA